MKINQFKHHTKPFAHQKKALSLLDQNKAFALFMEMGTGKTKVVVDYIEYLRQAEQIKKVLIIAPNSILDVEVEQFKTHLPEIIFQTRYNFHILRGPKVKKQNTVEESSDLARTFPEHVQIVIVNYESARTIAKDLYAYNADLIVLDESSRIKNSRAQQSKAIHALAGCPRKILMSGTPISNSYIDIFSQYKFLDPTLFGMSYTAFRARYCVMGGFQFRQIIRYVNLEELIKKIHSKAMFCLKKDCLDLPDKLYKEFTYEMSKEQATVYKDLKNEMIAEYKKGTISVSQAIVKLLRLQQICSGFMQLDEHDCLTHFKENPKLNLLLEIIDEYGIDKMVVWCRYIAEIRTLEKALGEKFKEVYTFYGATPQPDRIERVKKFNDAPHSAVFIGQIHTGGLGITLTGAHVACYYSNSYSLEDRSQSEDRLHRIGQKNNVTYIDLIGKGTLESSILKVLRKKQNLADVVIRNKGIEEVIEGNI